MDNQDLRLAVLIDADNAPRTALREIMAEASLLGTSSSNYFECYLDAFIVYFILSKIITILQNAVERHLNRKGGTVR